MDLTRSGQFQIITDPASRGWLSHQSPDYLTFEINLLTFGSTFSINFLNQPTQSAFSWNRRRHWLVIRCFLQTYVRRIVLLPTEVGMIQVVDLLPDHPLVETWSVSLSSTPWWRYGWKPCWTQLKTFPLCECQLCLQESQTMGMTKALVVNQWPPGLMNTLAWTWLDQMQRPLQVHVWNHETYQDDTNTSGWYKWQGQ